MMMVQSLQKVIFRTLQLVVVALTLAALCLMLFGFSAIRFDDGILGWLIPFLLVVPFVLLLRQLFIADKLFSEGSVNLANKNMMATSLIVVSLVSIYLWFVN